MKKNCLPFNPAVSVLTSAFCLLPSAFLFAQSPNGINYQGVARNVSGVPLVSQTISVQFKIWETQVGGIGTVVYDATHASITTNQFGLFNLVIGQGGTLNGGNFATIAWGSDAHFLEVFVDGTNMGATQFVSVPYAIHAATADSLVGSGGTNYWAKTGNSVHPVTSTDLLGLGTATAQATFDIQSAGNGSFIDGYPSLMRLRTPDENPFALVLSNDVASTAKDYGVYLSDAGDLMFANSPFGVFTNRAKLSSNGSLHIPGTLTKFIVDSLGDIKMVKGIPYTFPAVQGASGSVLQNNGAGTLSWVVPSGASFWSRTAPVTHLANAGDSVGIGTSSPEAKLHVESTGTEGAGLFRISDPANTNNALMVSTNGLANAGFFENTNAANNTDVFYAGTNGGGRAGFFEINNTSNSVNAVEAFTNGTGMAGFFNIANPANGNAALLAVTNGTGSALSGYNVGTGKAGVFQINKPTSAAEAVYAATNGIGTTVYAINTGGGSAGIFHVSDANNTEDAIVALTNGLSNAGHFEVANAVNSTDALYVTTNGLGHSGYFQIDNTSSTTDALYAATNGSGNAGNFFGKVKMIDLQVTGGASTAGYVLTDADGSGNAQWANPASLAVSGPWTDGGTSIYPTAASVSVGIGTTAPSAPLHVKGTLDPLQILLENTGGNFKTGYAIKTALKEWFIGQQGVSTTGFRIADISAGQTRLQISPAGEVGIGTISPEALLHLATSNGVVTNVFQLGNGNQPTREWLWEVDGASNFTLRNENLGTPLDVMYFSNAGNVGIGGVPGAKLDVNGNVKLGTAGNSFSALMTGMITIDPPAIGPNSSGIIPVAIAGITSGDLVFVTPPVTMNDGLICQGAESTAAGINIKIRNTTATGTDDPPLQWSYMVIKP